jgi:hypothetical protein
MSRRRAAVNGTAALATLLPTPAAAHAIGGSFQLPVPLWLYLVGAGVAVAASFVVTTFAARTPGDAWTYPTRPLPDGLASVARVALRILGVVWWYGAIVVGIVVGDISPLPAVLLWIGVWVGLPIVAILVGNPWPSFSPFRSTFEALEWVAARAGIERLDLGLRYPPRVARWPAVALLAAGLWAELVLPGSSVAGTVAALMIGYTLLALGGMVVFGPVAWLRNADLFEVELAWFGRIGPIGRRSRSSDLCEGCGEACDLGRCVDCPECAVAARDAERGVELRPWIVGLTDVRSAGWSDVAFIVTVLAGVTYDGLRETAAGAAGFDAVYPLVGAVLGPASAITFLLVETIQLAAVMAGFMGAFVAVSWLTRRLTGGHPIALGTLTGRYASTLLPIAGGYLIAHYLTLVIQGVVWLPSLLADPLLSLAPPLDAIPVSVVWYLSVAAIVGGHIAAIVLAHRLALEHAPRQATLAGLPIVALMVGYTVLSLWIIASPIVVEPGTVPQTGALSI